MIPHLSQSERSQMIERTAQLAAGFLIADDMDELNSLSPARVCGILDIVPATLAKLPIPRITLAPGIVRYRKSDLKYYLESKTSKP